MARDSNATRTAILQAAYTLFGRSGFTRVSMDEIATRSGFTKRTVYRHFESKDRLLAAVLEAQNALAIQAFAAFGDKLGGSPSNIVDGLFKELIVWSSKPRWPGSGYTRLAIELADMPGHAARKIARRHKATLEAELAAMFAKAGLDSAAERAREVWLLVEGAMVMILIHGDRGYARAAAEAAGRLIPRD